MIITDSTLFMERGKHFMKRMESIPTGFLRKIAHRYPGMLEYLMTRKSSRAGNYFYEYGKNHQPPCKKFSYITEEAANKFLSSIKNQSQKHKKPVLAYECEICGLWHLTSKPL